MLLQVLLQVNAIADQSIWSRAADQAFSVILLAAVASVLWNQYRKLEARMSKYMEEDRKQMMDIIQNNTRVLEHNIRIMERLEDSLDKK